MRNSGYYKSMIGEEFLCTLNIALTSRAGKDGDILLCCYILHIFYLFLLMAEYQWYKSCARSEAETNKERRLPDIKLSRRW
jgi:hypothetical protein